MIFREKDDGEYYLFEINEQGQFAVFLHYQEKWESLLDWQYSPEIKTGQENRLEVIAQGSEFHFYINNQFVASLVNEHLVAGKAGLLIGLSYSEEEAGWEFDDFELRSP